MVSNAELTTAIDSIGAPIIIVDVEPDERFVWRMINKAGERYFDLQNDEWVGKEVDSYEGFDEIRTSHRKRSAANYKRCVATKAPVFVENEHRGPDGVLWARNTIVPIFDDAGEVKQIMVTLLDITELKESQLEMNTILDTIGEPIIILDVNPGERFTFSFLNRAAEQYFGVSNDEYRGMGLENFEGLDATRIAQRKKSITVSKRCIVIRAPVISETKHLKRDGSYRWGRNTHAPIFDSNGEVRQIMVTSVDITELIESQNRLEDVLTKTLSGFVTICAKCKNIRDESENWMRVEQYMANHSDDVKFSHGYCPKCFDLAVQEIR